jgi:Phosphotransferase enzyme family
MFADELCPHQESLASALSAVLEDHSGAPEHMVAAARSRCEHGAHHEPGSLLGWLFIEYSTSSERVNLDPEPKGAMIGAARWPGQFHRWSDDRTLRRRASLLKAYDARYYEAWTQRAARFAGGRRDWVARLCERSSTALINLLVPEPVVIHGEFYDENVVVRDGVIYPVDWQSAAIGAGELDLASLTECWDDEISRACELEYQQARWPQGAPYGFGERLEAARVYWSLRWLGKWGEVPEYCASLRAAGEKLGLI